MTQEPVARADQRFRIIATVVFDSDTTETHMPFEPVSAPDRFEAFLKVARVMAQLGKDGMAFQLYRLTIEQLP